MHGQKTFNGVAILSKFKFDEVTPGLPGDPTPTTMPGSSRRRSRPRQGALRVASIYLPNGNPAPGRKISHTKSNGWSGFSNMHMNGFTGRAAGHGRRLQRHPDRRPTFTTRPPGPTDALFLPQTRAKFRTLANLGLTDAIRAVSDDPGLYTFWDYQAGAWQKNWGIRIDHLLLSPQAADRLTTAGIDKHVRSWERPSDHVPVYVDLAIDGA